MHEHCRLIDADGFLIAEGICTLNEHEGHISMVALFHPQQPASAHQRLLLVLPKDRTFVVRLRKVEQLRDGPEMALRYQFDLVEAFAPAV